MIIEMFREVEAILDGHFLLSSGKHSNRYIQCAKLLQYPDKAEKVINIVANKVKELEVDVVVGPAMGGIIVAYELGRQLGKSAIFTERENGKMKLRRGFEIKKGQKILISEDVVTTGKSSVETIQTIKEYGGEVIGIACLVDRRNSEVDLKYPIYSAIELEVENYDIKDCPLCQKGILCEKPGSRRFTE